MSIDWNQAIIQGPLAGYSHAAFRRLVWRYGAPTYCCTEMLPATRIIAEKGVANRYTYRDPIEATLCYQLSGSDAKQLALATAMVCDMGADVVDLNAGCPKRKIRRKRSGSALVEDPCHMAHLVEHMRPSCPAQLTVKIRVPEQVDRLPTLLSHIREAGADAIIIHPRRHDQHYDTPASIASVASAIQACPLPIIINGDIDGAEQAKLARQQSSAQGIMLGRFGYRSPWLSRCIREPTTPPPTLSMIGAMLQELLVSMATLAGEHATWLSSKSIAHHYRHHLPTDQQEAWVIAARACPDLTALHQCIETFWRL